MNFISIHQYFNRLYIAFFLLLMLPLLGFLGLYFLTEENQPVWQSGYYVVICVVALFDWLTAIIMFNKKIKSARNAQGLGAKLDKYFHITIVRYSFLSSTSLILAAGFYLSRSDVFTALYLMNLIFSLLLWPTGPRVSRELMLKGDERDMVYFKKDSF